MTDDTIPADKVKEIIEAMGRSLALPSETDNDLGHDDATQRWQRSLEALLPKPRTLADELRAFEARGHWDSKQLDSFADRVETLEQDRDIATDALKVEAEVASEAIDRVEEQSAEIIRLRAREIPDGWRIAEHEDYGTVIADPNKFTDGIIMIRYMSEDGHWHARCVSPYTLTFRDEEPAPEPEPIDPASCGRYAWYLVEVDGEARHGIRMDPGYSMPWVVILKSGRGSYASDEEVRVIRKLTCEEMDAR